MSTSFVFSKLFMIFLTIVAAFVAAKCGVLGRETNAVLSKAVLYVMNPALLISSSISKERLLTNGEVLVFLLIAFLYHFILIGLSFLVVRLLRIPEGKSKLYRFLFIFSNIGFFGLPAVDALFGGGAVFLVVIFLFPFQILSFTYGVTLVSNDPADQRIRPQMLLHPMVIACVVSIALYFAQVRLPGFLVDAIDFLGQGTSPGAMVVVGCALAFAPLKKVFSDWRLYVMSLLRMLVLPVAAFVLLRWLIPPSESSLMIITVCAVIMSMPSAANAAMLAAQYGGDVDTAASGVFLSTALSAVTIPLLIWLIQRI